MSDRKPLIWIVDDSRTEGAFTEHSLGSTYDFEYFEDGSIVVERLTTSRVQPDLLILDWVMPGMAGDEVCRFLRSHEPTKELPIIITTASRVETSDVVVGLSSGADDYVARPFAPEELRARVNAALRTRELAESSRRERRRLAAVNRLAQALLRVTDVRNILDTLAFVLVGSLCDGAGIQLLPNQSHEVAVARHRSDASAVAAIAKLADPCVHAFADDKAAAAQLSPAYRDYIARFGIAGLAIRALSLSSPLQGVVTVVRDGSSPPFDADDIVTIETCIEYCSLAIANALRFEAERTARTQLYAVLQSLPVGILATDAEGKLTLVNSAATELLPGIDRAHALADVYHLAKWSTLDGTPIDEASWLGKPTSGRREQLMMRTPTGDERTIAVSAVHDGTRGVVTVIDDISAERAITVERERVARLQEEMVAIVSHDLRTPLGAFLAGIDLLTAATGNYPELGSVVTRMRSSGRRMSKIVEQLLDVTHARLGKGVPIAPSETSLRTVLDGVVAETLLVNPHAKIEVLATNDAVGMWDADRLAQVFANLMTNAAHYGRQGGPIWIELAVVPGAACVAVRNLLRDQPIPRELLAVMFDPFQRGRAAARDSGGLGLGLYIVREIIHAHGGTVDVESDVQGTTFRVTLPLPRAA